MQGSESASLFGSIFGMAVGGILGGPIGAMMGGSLLGGALGSIFGAREQKKEQKRLEELQNFQQGQLLKKLKADNEQLFSTVKSATAQTSGAMGAVY